VQSTGGRFACQVWFGDTIVTKLWNTGVNDEKGISAFRQ
jgi:hypothetical protein